VKSEWKANASDELKSVSIKNMQVCEKSIADGAITFLF